MKKHFGLLTASFLLISSLGSAQNVPGRLSLCRNFIGDRPGEFNETVVLKLPENATLDDVLSTNRSPSYERKRQKSPIESAPSRHPESHSHHSTWVE